MNQKIKLPEITTEERHWIVERPQPEVPSQGQIPAWHDAPTVPGDWVIVGKGFKSELQTSITQQEIDRGSSWPGRWYGPIPPDQSPPAQTRHGPGAADRAHPAGVTPPGHSFIDFYFDFDKLSKST